jgi:DNA polymerase-3 subunit delta'
MADAPLCYTQLLGQQKAKDLLTRSLTSGRMAHGYLFKGPEGVGKSLYARGFAAAINCREVNRIGACGICNSCRKFRSDNHPDLMVVKAEKGTIKIDMIRRMITEISFAPFESSMRVVVIEDVQNMGREAANSLLKTLEEPPLANLLILTADSSEQVLPTLISRCQVVPFSPLCLKDCVTILTGQGVEEKTARLLARLSEGSPGRARILLDTEMIELWHQAVDFLNDSEIKGDAELGELLGLADKLGQLKENLYTLLGLFRLWIRDLLLAANEPAAFSGGRKSPKSWSSAELFAKLRAIDRAEQQLARNCNKNLVCEVLLFKLQG